MSSPSRQVIDPLICSYSENTERRPRMSLSSSGNNVHVPGSKPLAPQQNNPNSSWTPLVSRTFTNDLGSMNSTPGSKFFTSMYKQNGLGSGSQFQTDADFGLNLTPFLTHNMNLLAQPNSAGNMSVSGNFTPYFDKSMNLADFYMDSPIRQTPGKIEAFSPSKFQFSDENTNLNAALSVKKPAGSHQPKRSITSLDTPARHPAKKPDTSLTPGEFRDHEENLAPAKKFDDSHFVTPSKKKILRETSASALNKTPLRHVPFNKSPLRKTPTTKTPVRKTTIRRSSLQETPRDEARAGTSQSGKMGCGKTGHTRTEMETSTISGSGELGESGESGESSLDKTPLRRVPFGQTSPNKNTGKSQITKTPLKPPPLMKHSFTTPAQKHVVSSPSTVIMSSAVRSPVSNVRGKPIPPPSPTPLKDQAGAAAPVMGIFSEKKAVNPKPTDSESSERKPSKKHGGSNKFQIVFTDVHTLMNSKKNKKSSGGTNGRRVDGKAEKKKSKSKVTLKPTGADANSQAGQNLQPSQNSHFAFSSQSSHGLQSGQNLHTLNFNSQFSDHTQGIGNGMAGASPSYTNQFHAAPSFSVSQEFNTSMASSKDFSTMHSSTVNTSGGNMTSTDHASFDLMHNGLNSTPNGKFLLDHSFEKHSPSVVHNVSAQRFASMHRDMHGDIHRDMHRDMHGDIHRDMHRDMHRDIHGAIHGDMHGDIHGDIHGDMRGELSEKGPRLHQQLQNEMHAPREYMPPPKVFTLQQAAQVALRSDKAPYEQSAQVPQYEPHFAAHSQYAQQAPVALNVLMSTPQHESVVHGNISGFSHEDASPSAKDSLGFLYQDYPHQQGKSPHSSQVLGFITEPTTSASPVVQPEGAEGSKKSRAATKKAAKRKPKKG